MEVCSPKDGLVVLVSVTDGQEVVKGQPLLQMDTIDEDRDRDKLTKLETIRKLMAAQYEGEELVAARRLAQIAVELAENVRKTKDVLYHKNVTAIELIDDPIMWADFVIEQGKTDYPNSKLNVEKAELQLKQFDFAISRHKAMNIAVQTYIQSQLETLEKKRKLLTVIAPVGGRVSLRVDQNSFAELGSVLLEIDNLKTRVK